MRFVWKVGSGALTLLLLAAGLVLTTVSPASAVQERVWTVNNAGDVGDAAVGNGVCATAAGVCTLRAALEESNALRGPDRINFAIGTGRKRIEVLTLLPELADPYGGITIDGYTQPGSRVNSTDNGSNARIMIEIVEASSGILEAGFTIRSPENVIRGLSISGFDANIVLVGLTADGNKIIGNFVGPTATGGYVEGSRNGIRLLLGPSQNTIGTPARADRNVVSGNGGVGIVLNHGDTHENIIQNNVIGLTPAANGRLPQLTGVDIQWYTWGNLVGGNGVRERNIISGNQQEFDSFKAGVDLSHSSTGNLIIGNYIGTLPDGNTATDYSSNLNGIEVKDNSNNNYIANNVVTNSAFDGLKHRHNYSGPNTFVNNLVGIGVNGDNTGNGRYAVYLNGHDIIHKGNVFANSSPLIYAVDETYDPITDPHTNYPPGKTVGNAFYETTFINGSTPQIDLAPFGYTLNDANDADEGPNRGLNASWNDGLAEGIATGHLGSTCGGCRVEILISGTSPAGLATSANGGYWIGSTIADANGLWGFKSTDINAGENLTIYVIDAEGNTSETRSRVVPTTPWGNVSNSRVTPLAPAVTIPEPRMPRPYSPEDFSCSWASGTLSWTNVGASVYYVGAYNNDVFTYVGSSNGSSIAAPPSDRYEVSHYRDGFLVNTFCTGPGTPQPTSTIGISVVDLSGDPVPNVGVDLFTEGRVSWVNNASTNANGQASFQVLDGCYVVTLIARGTDQFSSGKYSNKSVCVNGNTASVTGTLLINPGTSTTKIAGTVTDRTSAPVAGIGIDLFTSNTNGDRLSYVRSTATDAAGAFNFDLTEAGCYVMTFVAPAGKTFVGSSGRYLNRSTCVTSGATGSVNATLDQGQAATDAVLSGKITNSANAAVPGVNVDLFLTEADGSRGTWLAYTTSAANGSISFTKKAGCYTLTYVAPQGQTWAANGSRWRNRSVCVTAGETRTGLDAALS